MPCFPSQQPSQIILLWSSQVPPTAWELPVSSLLTFNFVLGHSFPGDHSGKQWPAKQETQETRVWSLRWEDLLAKEMATHSSIVAWEIHGRRDLGATVHGVAKSWTRLSNFTHTHTHTQMIQCCDSSMWTAKGLGHTCKCFHSPQNSPPPNSTPISFYSTWLQSFTFIILNRSE